MIASEVHMKKLISAILLISLIFALSSCMMPEISTGTGTGTEHIVTLSYNNGEADYKFSVGSNERGWCPKDPVREGYIFCGWYKNASLTEPYDFSSALVSSLTLYAKWIPDYEYISAKLADTALKSCVKLYVTHSKLFGTSKEYATGSGVIFKQEGNTYYALTNNHVVSSENASYNNTDILISDAYGNQVRAYVKCQSAEYDLAVVYFTSDVELYTVEMDVRPPDRNEPVIALGHPNGLINVTTYGEVVNIDTAGEGAQNSVSNVTFPVLWHTADVDHGSSGGALLSIDFKLLGVNYATSTKESGEFAYGFAIPTEKVAEFLSENFE